MFLGISKLYDRLSQGVDHTSKIGEADIDALTAFCAQPAARKAG